MCLVLCMAGTNHTIAPIRSSGYLQKHDSAIREPLLNTNTWRNVLCFPQGFYKILTEYLGRSCN